jgi:hypothetical protein
MADGILVSGELLISKYFNDDGKTGDNHVVNCGHLANDIEMRVSGKENGVYVIPSPSDFKTVIPAGITVGNET